ncbi:MAG TPA: acyltransferase [Bryobacteraceae bacterium]|nr:acyltransferase [Bryobacteraceae bacterium]
MSVSAVLTTPALDRGTPSGVEYNVSIGYLRAFITIMVLAHHAVIAYIPFLPPAASTFTAEPRLWRAFPIVDSQRWAGFGTFTGFNDLFFMSLMFFLSGLFVWSSLQHKGSGVFLRDRLRRLGVPFIAAAAIIAPLAYYPAYLVTGADASPVVFLRQWFSMKDWPAGPAWFVWVLLAFDCVAAALFAFMPKWGETLARVTSGAIRRPIAFFGLLLAVSAAVYIPMALTFSPVDWSAFGPFTFQTSRILHYFLYFAAGIVVGAYGLDRGLLAMGGKLARRWPLWVTAMLLAFGFATVIFFASLQDPKNPAFWGTLNGFAFTLSCAASSFAFLAVFVRFAQRSRPLFNSLRDNAYGMYLIHYAFASWLQYCLLKTALPAIAKGSLVVAGTVVLSSLAVAAMRRIPAVARVI